MAVVMAGIFQVGMGFAKAGIIGYFFPSSVISGMLAGIGIIILKQIPHALGYDRDYEGDISFFQDDGYNTFTELLHLLNFITPSAVIVALVSLLILILWEQPVIKNNRIFKLFPGSLIAVLAGMLINQALRMFYPELTLGEEHL